MQLASQRFAATIALAAAVTVGTAGGIRAAPVLTFAQTTSADLIDATNPTVATTLIEGSSVPILVGQYAGAGAPFAAFLDLDLTSTGAAAVFAGQLLQPFSGAATFTSGASGAGTNYLSATFTDTVFGLVGGSGLTLLAAEPPGSVTFTSGVLTPTMLQDPKAIALAFADVTGPVTVLDGTLAGFTSTVSGTISAAPPAPVVVPEPAGMTLLAVGAVVAVAAFARRRSDA